MNIHLLRKYSGRAKCKQILTEIRILYSQWILSRYITLQIYRSLRPARSDNETRSEPGNHISAGNCHTRACTNPHASGCLKAIKSAISNIALHQGCDGQFYNLTIVD